MKQGINQTPAVLADTFKDKSEAQAKTALLNLLSQLKIQKIVYIDDRCSINELKEAYVGKLKAHYDNKPEELDFVNWELPEAPFEKDIIKIWDEKDDAQRREIFLKIITFEGNNEELENSTAPLKLKDLLKDKIELLSPTEWIEKKNEILSSLTATNKILFLFDIEFVHAPLPDLRDGRDLAFELLQDKKISEYLHCGLFSHLFDTIEEYDKRSEYCNTHNLEKEKFYTISKKRFQNSSYLPGLAEGIRNTLLINEVESLKKETSAILRSSFSQSIQEINSLTPESFNHIIQRSSKLEGVWEMSTLIRISNIITTNSALTRLLPNDKRKKINQCLEKIRLVEKIKTGSETPIVKSQVIKLREKELYISNEILNRLHYPISNGDIFNIENKDYILLVQPCNVTLRSSGSRDRKYNIGFLVELETIDQDNYLKFKKGQLATLEIVEDVTLPNDKVKIVRYSTFQPVSLSPLDLTVFNNDGSSKMNLSESESNSAILQDSWKKRYKDLYKEFSEFSEGIKTYRKIKIANKNTIKKSIFNGPLFSGFKIDNENCLSKSGKLLEFNIKRVSHYRSPFSDDLLQKFMLYLSRNAFDHDFSN
ncbi:hypothetical protein [Niastella populi]|uniref:Uncharacterized protein n=1 Tax=Niastella populi TaxID=550983 RepID=A0A1V9FH60_9BACT|nr:hypothetical protein [Niastella populi]OQP57601.1 hypothetical protein A4R26_24055 [Niastella populi]